MKFNFLLSPNIKVRKTNIVRREHFIVGSSRDHMPTSQLQVEKAHHSKLFVSSRAALKDEDQLCYFLLIYRTRTDAFVHRRRKGLRVWLYIMSGILVPWLKTELSIITHPTLRTNLMTFIDKYNFLTKSKNKTGKGILASRSAFGKNRR